MFSYVSNNSMRQSHNNPFIFDIKIFKIAYVYTSFIQTHTKTLQISLALI
jgi:hypothetical protein